MLGNLKRKIGKEEQSLFLDSNHHNAIPCGSFEPGAALASILNNSLSILVEKPAFDPFTHLNAVNAYPHPSLISDAEQWNFDRGFRKNATENLVFDAGHSFLQHWLDTRCRNGTFVFRPLLVLQECFISSFIGHNMVLG